MTLVKQGTDECLAACLAMLAGVKLPTIKRKLKQQFGITWKDLIRGWVRAGAFGRTYLQKGTITSWLFDTFAPELGDGPKVAGTFNMLYDKTVNTPHWTEMQTGTGLAFLVAGSEAHAICFKDNMVYDPNWNFPWPVFIYFTVTLPGNYFHNMGEVRTWIFKRS